MMPALRLTILSMVVPAMTVVGQVTPKAPRPPRTELPRIKEPRDVTPRPMKWSDDMADFRFDMQDWKFEMPDMHFDTPMFDKLDMQFDKFDKMDMQFDKFDKMDLKFDKFDQLDKFDRFDMKVDKFDSKLHELDMRLGDMKWGADHYMGVTPMPSDRGRESFMTRPRAAWIQGDVADSVYRAAYELLNRGEWRRSASAFANIPQKYPNSGYVADALYWQAFSLYRIGNTDDLQTALKSLELMRTKYPAAKSQSDAAALTTRIRGALASRGDRAAEQELRRTM